MQTVKTKITMDAEGSLTVPEEIRQALAINDATFIELEVVDDALVLRPGEAIPAKDLWAYTPAHIARVKRALAEGSGRRMSEAELERLITG